MVTERPTRGKPSNGAFQAQEWKQNKCRGIPLRSISFKQATRSNTRLIGKTTKLTYDYGMYRY